MLAGSGHCLEPKTHITDALSHLRIGVLTCEVPLLCRSRSKCVALNCRSRRWTPHPHPLHPFPAPLPWQSGYPCRDLCPQLQGRCVPAIAHAVERTGDGRSCRIGLCSSVATAYQAMLERSTSGQVDMQLTVLSQGPAEARPRVAAMALANKRAMTKRAPPDRIAC